MMNWARIQTSSFAVGCLSFCLVVLSAGQVRSQTVPTAGGPSTARPTTKVLAMFTDGAGNPAPVPAKDEIKLKFDRKSVVIEELRGSVTEPLYFSILVDVSGSTREIADLQTAAAMRIFEQLSQGGNHGHLVLFNEKVSASDRYFSSDEVGKTLAEFPGKSRKGGTALYDAVDVAISHQLGTPAVPQNSRRSIVILSDGEDNSSRLPITKIIEEIQKARIPVFPVDFSWGQTPTNQRAARHALQVFQNLGEASGGTVLDPRGANLAERCAGLLRTQTLVAFDSPETKDGKWYPIMFESTNKGIRVLAASEYFVPAGSH
jgi:hypothetical protein